MICDIAETYHVLNYEGLPVPLLATLVFGLRDNSRTKMKLSGAKHPLETMLMASMADSLSFLGWTKTKEAQKGHKRPKSILSAIMDTNKKEEINSYVTSEDFKNAWDMLRSK